MTEQERQVTRAIRERIAVALAPVLAAAEDKGMTEQALSRLVAAESLNLAAHAHVEAGGSDALFTTMASTALESVRTGAPQQ